MKKILLGCLAAGVLFAAAACAARPKLHILNWGDYMDRTLVAEFEDRYDVEVVYRTVGSNEEMASLIEASSSHYDIAIPSDYMIDRLADLGLIQPIDFDRIPNYGDLTVMPRLAGLYGATPWADYAVPYAWGTIGILYDTTIPGLADFIEARSWDALFTAGDAYDVGMYDSARDAVAAALLSYGFDVNSTDEEELAMAEDLLLHAGFTAWGEDSLRELVVSGTLDLALVYSGDYFSEYAAATAAGRAITFDYYVPSTTNVWLDAICIPTNAQDLDLAYLFIDFMLDDEHALQNSVYIGYAPPFSEHFAAVTAESAFAHDMSAFDPYPAGSVRQMYEYVSAARSDALEAILARAKAGE